MAMGKNRDAETAGAQKSAKAARRSGNPAKSGKFPESSSAASETPEAPEAETSGQTGRMTIRQELEEERLQKIAAEMTAAGQGQTQRTPTWYVAIMLGLMLLGLLWIIVFYTTQAMFPIPQLGNWNIGVGIGLLMVGVIMTTRWR